MKDKGMFYRWHTLVNLTDREQKMLNDWSGDREKLEKEVKELRDNLKYTLGVLKNNHTYHGEDNHWKCSDDDCVGCMLEKRYLKDSEDE